MKRIVLCADDYGQALTISEAIIALLEKNRLSAVSCLVNQPDWRAHAEKLKNFKNKIDIGLHFNLTQGSPISQKFRLKYGNTFENLNSILLKSFLHLFDQAAVRAELEAQISAFEDAFGVLPDFIDGHQHIHQLPQVRRVLIETFQSKFTSQQTYLRWTHDDLFSGNGTGIKKIIINLTGLGFDRLLDEYHIPYNPSFAGIYNFGQAKFPAVFKSGMQRLGNRGIFMCHPALIANSADPIGSSRKAEYEFLQSAQFNEICQNEKVIIGRFFAK